MTALCSAHADVARVRRRHTLGRCGRPGGLLVCGWVWLSVYLLLPGSEMGL